MNHRPTENVQKVTEQVKKVRKIDTNFCQKLALDKFIHIALAPDQGIPESVLERTIIELGTRDGSWPPVLVKLTDLARFNLTQLQFFPDRICQDSHGMTSEQLTRHLMQRHPAIHPTTELAIYYYQKIQNPQS